MTKKGKSMSTGDKPRMPNTGEQRRFSRRALVQWVLGVGAAFAMGAMSIAALSIRPTKRNAKQQEPVAAGDRLVFVIGANKGQPIRRDSIPVNEAVLAFPEGKDGNPDNLILLCHLDPVSLAPPTILAWTAEGLVAYSAICTHLGCTASTLQRMEGTDFPQLLCPCHSGVFDPQSGAIVKAGPPPRPLPQLPIQIDNQGELIAAGWFEEPPGVVPKGELRRWREKNKN